MLIRQFLVESLVYFTISFGFAVLLFIGAFPTLRSFTGNPLPLVLNRRGPVFAGTVGVVLIITLLTGLYPAWSLSRPKAIAVFSHSATVGRNGNIFRRSLVVFQFAISLVLLIAAMVVHRQFKLLDETPVGYEKENLVVADRVEWGQNLSAFKNELSGVSGVQTISVSDWMPGGDEGNLELIKDPTNPEQEITVAFISGDISFSKAMGFRLERGRWLSESYGSDLVNIDSVRNLGLDPLGTFQSTQSELVTKSTALKLGIKELGRPVQGLRGIPVGVIADFRNGSLKEPSGPCAIQAIPKATYGRMLVRILPGTSDHVKASFAKIFRKYYPSFLLKLDDASDLLASQYATKRKLTQIFYFFSSLIVFLACMGLFGLVTFMVQSHVKEIGIRKVLGASTKVLPLCSPGTSFDWSFFRR